MLAAGKKGPKGLAGCVEGDLKGLDGSQEGKSEGGVAPHGDGDGDFIGGLVEGAAGVGRVGSAPVCLDVGAVLGDSWESLGDFEDSQNGSSKVAKNDGDDDGIGHGDNGHDSNGNNGNIGDNGDDDDGNSPKGMNKGDKGDSDNVNGSSPSKSAASRPRKMHGKFWWRKGRKAEVDDLNSLQETQREARERVEKEKVKGKRVSIFSKSERATGGAGGGRKGKGVIEDEEDDNNEEDNEEVEEDLMDGGDAPPAKPLLVPGGGSDLTAAGDPNVPSRSPSDSPLSSQPSSRSPKKPLASSAFICTQLDLVLPKYAGDGSDGSSGSISSGRVVTDNSSSSSNSSHSSRRSSSNSSCVNSSNSCSNVHKGWRYECMMVEVKGPYDTLADHQLMWLRVLDTYGVRAVVGKIKEKEKEEKDEKVVMEKLVVGKIGRERVKSPFQKKR